MLTIGSPLPTVSFEDTDGRPVEPVSGPTVIYFMRSASCAICNAHARDLAARAAEFTARGVRVLVALPESRDDAATWKTEKHSPFTVVTGAGGTPHAALGLKRKLWGQWQQSGTVVVDADGFVRHAQVATMPTGAYDKKTLAAALDAVAPVAA